MAFTGYCTEFHVRLELEVYAGIFFPCTVPLLNSEIVFSFKRFNIV